MKNLSFILLLLPLLIYGQDFPRKPTNYVTTFDPFYLKESFFSQQEEELLNAKLRAFEDSTGIQLLVYITLNGHADSEVYSWKIFDTWGIGQKGKANGALISIFTSGPTFTLTGPGLDAILPPDACMEILEEEMKPHLQTQNFYKAIDSSLDKLTYYSKHPYEPPGLLENIKKKIPAALGIGVLTLPFIINFLLKRKRRS